MQRRSVLPELACPLCRGRVDAARSAKYRAGRGGVFQVGCIPCDIWIELTEDHIHHADFRGGLRATIEARLEKQAWSARQTR